MTLCMTHAASHHISFYMHSQIPTFIDNMSGSLKNFWLRCQDFCSLSFQFPQALVQQQISICIVSGMYSVNFHRSGSTAGVDLYCLWHVFGQLDATTHSLIRSSSQQLDGRWFFYFQLLDSLKKFWIR